MSRRYVLFPAALLTAAVLIGSLPAPARAADYLDGEVVQGNLVNPWDVSFTPDGRMLVTERPGRLRVYASGAPGAALLATHTIPSVRAEGEAGLMGLAVDRQFASNERIYLCASRTTSSGWRNQVLRYRLDTSTSLVFERMVISGGMYAHTIHNGCAVEHMADGMIWVAMGDAANPSLAQNPMHGNGKIHRVTPDGGVPANNPIMPGATRRTTIFSMGHRNPQGLAQQPGTNQVYATEHGPDRDDEINRIVGGANYGWPCYTGNGNPYQTSGCGPASSYRTPAWTSGTPTWATSGAAFGGSACGRFNPYLYVPTLKESDLRRFAPVTNYRMEYRATYFDGAYGRLRGVARGPGACLYLTTSNGSGDRVIRVVLRTS